MENRIIKFRAWDNKNKAWLCGYEYPNLGGFSLTGEVVLFGEWGNVFDQFVFERNGKKWDDLKIMQYTGLKDKNGKEIYEGDIVKDRAPWVWVVRFGELEEYEVPFIGWYLEHQEKSDYSGPFSSDDMPHLEVIGNIYEHPHLLEPK
jgi:uncharacterized phage protein (TIGR01671 family)